MRNPRKAEKGFTLIELMVSLTIFSIVMTISIGTLLVLVDMNAKAQALYSATTNLSFALDSLAREVRMGYHYYCHESSNNPTQDLPIPDTIRDCDNNDTTSRDFIAFIREEDGKQMAYRLNGDSIQVNVDGSGWMDITADDVVVETFEITVKDSSTLEDRRPTVPDSGGNAAQPTIDLTVKGYVNNGLDSETDFFIQTHIVQRRIDII